MGLGFWRYLFMQKLKHFENKFCVFFWVCILGSILLCKNENSMKIVSWCKLTTSSD